MPGMFASSHIPSKQKAEEIVEATKKRANKFQTQDVISLFIVLVLLPLGFLLEITYVLPFWHSINSTGWLLRVIPLLLLGFNFYTNLLMLYIVGPNGKSSDLPTVMKPGFIYCHTCSLNAPPRAFHCPVCEKCYYRRDHHCSFAATCVGHFNQRYFISGVVTLLAISAVCCVWNASYLRIALERLMAVHPVVGIWQVLMPHLALFFGYLTFHQFFAVFTFMSSLATFAFAAYLLAAQLFCLYRGQTRVEYLMDVHAYNLGFFENLRQAMGSRWPLALFLPFINSPLQSDGITFVTPERQNVYKSTKNI